MEALIAAMFAAGLASGAHCVAMCGGIVAAFGLAQAQGLGETIRRGLLCL